MKNLAQKLGYKWTDKQIAYILKERETGKLFTEIAESFNKKFASEIDGDKSSQTIRQIYVRYQNEDISPDAIIQSASTRMSTQKKNAQLSKENRVILDQLVTKETFLSELSEMISGFKFKKQRPKKVPSRRGYKKQISKELMISDNHIGALTDNFNYAIAEKRYNELASSFIQDMETDSKQFYISNVDVALLGDIMHSSTMHEMESLGACESENSDQIVQSIRMITKCILIPIAIYCQIHGIQMTVVGITGNHDRTHKEKTFNFAGKKNTTWIIYNACKDLLIAHGFNKVIWHIPETPYFVLERFGSNILYEHGDLVKSLTPQGLISHLLIRGRQLNKSIKFLRIGHIHTYNVIDRGVVISNASLIGGDGYSDALGYTSQAVQVINTYIKTENRPDCFWKSMGVYLGNIV